MISILVLVVLILLLDLAAMRWGADSRDGPDSQEWQRRGSWFLPVDHASPSGHGGEATYLYLYRCSPAQEQSS
ncbi:hypothetical protein [Thermogemmatispora sp.]|uniref:hypothetical protein n=1 Tax=Thermogemmatispora sp. TaxID=1968838 RepID=UPI001D42BF0B|nr:hypothetical protein [Thermogemmatispora sp.]MBX5450082.1 hypothetical protein [Thermogemmatispora sp.]